MDRRTRPPNLANCRKTYGYNRVKYPHALPFKLAAVVQPSTRSKEKAVIRYYVLNRGTDKKEEGTPYFYRQKLARELLTKLSAPYIIPGRRTNLLEENPTNALGEPKRVGKVARVVFKLLREQAKLVRTDEALAKCMAEELPHKSYAWWLSRLPTYFQKYNRGTLPGMTHEPVNEAKAYPASMYSGRMRRRKGWRLDTLPVPPGYESTELFQ